MVRPYGTMLALAAVLVAAQAASALSPEERYEQALEAMLEDVADPQKSFDFVKAASEVGDQRGAISALERLLLINPTLANIQLELGVMYLRTGATDLAIPLIEQALRAPNVPRVVRQRAEQYLARAERGQRRNIFRGYLSLGGRDESNANAGPVDDQILIGGIPGTLSEESLETPDTSFMVTGALRHIYQTRSQRGHTFDSNLFIHSSNYNELNELDLFLSELDLGPRIFFGDSLSPPFSVRPFVSGSYWTLAGEKYLTTFGGGLEMRQFFSRSFLGNFRVHYRDRSFSDYVVNDELRQVEDRSGDNIEAELELTKQFGRFFQLTGLGAYEDNSAEADFESYDRISLGLFGRFFFGGRKTNLPWTLTVGGNYRDTKYDAFNPDLTSDIVREDNRYDGSVRLQIPFGRFWTVWLQGVYTENDSTLNNFDFENVSGSVGLDVRF